MLNGGDGLVFRCHGQIGYAVAVGLGLRAAKVFLGDISTQAGLDQRRAGHAHGGLALDHAHEVGQGGIVGGPGKTPAQHGHGLGHPAGIAR